MEISNNGVIMKRGAMYMQKDGEIKDEEIWTHCIKSQEKRKNTRNNIGLCINMITL